MNNYLRDIVDICHANLSDQHRDYMLARGLSGGTIDDYMIGTFPSEIIRKRIPLDFLRSKKILFKNKNGKFWSEFDNRVIIPIFDHCGEAVGITGRIIQDIDRAKYYNSDYSKSTVLFGLHNAKKHILESNSVVVVEGNLDVLAASEAGVKNVVAVCGTAFTVHHVHLLLRYCDQFTLAFDRDQAGDAVRVRSLAMMDYYVSTGLASVKQLQLPDGVKDIGQLVQELGNTEANRVITSGVPQDAPPEAKVESWGWNVE